MKTDSHLKVAVLCGGPSMERGISLNSARSVLDHLSSDAVDIVPLYVDVYKNFYALSAAQLYSNTPSDFDFKLPTTAHKLSEDELLRTLKAVDIVFPVIHGTFGEDGQLQSFLENHGIPFVGSGSTTCQTMFTKPKAAALLRTHGYHTLPSKVLKKGDPALAATIRHFFSDQKVSRVVIKPTTGGSSIGVFSASTPEEALEKATALFRMNIGDEALLEPFCSGREFTVILLQNPDGSPVALMPTEIEVDYTNGGIFDYRRKYLPTTNTHWYCPPRFDDRVVDGIRKQAENLFSLFHMRDFARMDGWLFADGTILFSDFNPISGMEQNSFIFQQASRIGFTHGDLLWNIVAHACLREGRRVPQRTVKEGEKKEPVHILFGGNTAERQVSLMSGTNVWLKLRRSPTYAPEPFLLDKHNCVWHLPYTYALNHTVEEIYENCITAHTAVSRMEHVLRDIQSRLVYAPKPYTHAVPTKVSFDDFVAQARATKAFVFLALHGGDGENGVFQERLERADITYNGSSSKASELCMDKFLTGQVIATMGHPQILTVPKKRVSIASLYHFCEAEYEKFWASLQQELGAETFIIKPQRDGCSAGIVRLFTPRDLQKYVAFVQQKSPCIPGGTFQNQPQPIDMPLVYEDDFLLESFVETDFIRICKNELVYRPKTGWVELTCGVLEQKGEYTALNPSITVAEGEVLSVEEKFQGGTGVNITPPFEDIISKESRDVMKQHVETIAKTLSIRNYARLDLFFHIPTNRTILIEANSLPALTPATVLYQQALSETPPMYPRNFIEKLIAMKKDAQN